MLLWHPVSAASLVHTKALRGQDSYLRRITAGIYGYVHCPHSKVEQKITTLQVFYMIIMRLDNNAKNGDKISKNDRDFDFTAREFVIVIKCPSFGQMSIF